MKEQTLDELRAAAKGLDMDIPAREELFAGAFDVTMRRTGERAFLTICQQIYRDNRGSDTPFESFVVGIVRDHAREAGTRGHIRMEFEQFDRDWGSLIHAARRLYRQHSELVTSEKLEDTEDPDVDFAEIADWAAS